jgi:hypothetical protein
VIGDPGCPNSYRARYVVWLAASGTKGKGQRRAVKAESRSTVGAGQGWRPPDSQAIVSARNRAAPVIEVEGATAERANTYGYRAASPAGTRKCHTRGALVEVDLSLGTRRHAPQGQN